MAISHMALGELDKAEVEIKQALSYYSTPTGLNSPHVAAALSASAELASKKGNFKEAEGLYENALQLTEDKFGKNYAWEVINKNLGEVRRKL